MSYNDENELAIDSLYENGTHGHFFHEWIVTADCDIEGWWGEGYIVHTVSPFVTAKWGFTSENERLAFPCSIKVEENRYISCLPMNTEGNKNIDELLFQMPIVTLQFLHIKYGNKDSEEQVE